MKRNEFIELPRSVQDYLQYSEAVKNKSKLTILEAASDLRTFFRYMKVVRGLAKPAQPFEEIDLQDIDSDFIKTISLQDAYGFLVFCKEERDNAAKTRARKVSTLRNYFHYLYAQKNMLPSDPMLELDTPKLPKTLPKYLTLEESRKLLASVDGKYKERDYAILTLFLNCGLRLAELVSLNYTDIRDDHTMVVTGKGNKQRMVYLNDACLLAIEAYRKVRPVENVKDKKALFLSSRNQRISPKTVQYLVKDYLEKAGFGGRGLSVHKLRHTAATLMYQHGHVDVLVLKEILGHENLGTTEIYTHLADEQIKAASDANPLSTLKPSNQGEKR